MSRGMLSLFLIALKFSSIVAADLDWWKTAVIYQIYPRSFKDTDGDGIGDLQGVIDSLDYIKELGVDAIWLSPIYPTEDKDFGYDITDMTAINPIFGNITTFKTLIATFHKAGLKVLLDFVPNHTSNKHKWFLKSINGTDKYADYYVWRPGSTVLTIVNGTTLSVPKVPNNWMCGITDESAWTYDNYRRQFYLHQFLKEQPDLNYENEDVLNEMNGVLHFWLNEQVDGFRMDAVYTICENQDFSDEKIGEHGERYHEKTFDQPKTFEVLKRFRSKLDEFTRSDNITRLMMVENYNSDPNVIKKYYGTSTTPIAHFPFNFYLIMNLSLDSSAVDWANCINEWYKVMGPENNANWVLGNHDQPRVASRFTSEYVDLLNIIVLTLKGTTITYFGEELGMPNSIVRRDQAKDPQGFNNDFLTKSRDPERGPFIWNTNTTAGFSSSLEPWLPVTPSYWALNVKTQNESTRSHLKLYREMIKLRKTRTLKYGNIAIIAVNENVLAIFRNFIDNPTVVILINFGDVTETINLIQHRNSLPEVLYYYTSSININDYKDKNNNPKQYDPYNIALKPKGALVLSTFPIST